MFGLKLDDFQASKPIRGDGHFLLIMDFRPEANAHLSRFGQFLDAQFRFGGD